MSTLQTYNLKHPDASGNQITFTSGGDVNFDNGAVYLDSTNNRLGVGTSSPSSLLDVEGIVTAKAGAFDAGGFLNKYGSDANSRSWWVKTDTHGFGDFAIRQSTTQSGSSYDTKLLIDSSGSVGIGSTTVSSKLHVEESTVSGKTTVLTLEAAGLVADDGPAIDFIPNGSATASASIVGARPDGSGVDGYLGFYTNNATTNSEKMRLDSSGRLLVNATSTSTNEKLQVTGSAKFDGLSGNIVTFTGDGNWHDIVPSFFGNAAYLLRGLASGPGRHCSAVALATQAFGDGDINMLVNSSHNNIAQTRIEFRWNPSAAASSQALQARTAGDVSANMNPGQPRVQIIALNG